jgi:YesN/AraC family two-component response regulator
VKKILLVDDERWVRAALKWTIKSLNLPLEIVNECENGLAALDWLKNHEVDLIITDIRMPIMDGLTFVKGLKQIKENQDIIVISVHDEFQFVQQALRSGVVDYLLKPIEESELKVCLQKWLDKPALLENKTTNTSLEVDEKPSTTIEQVLSYIKKTPLAEVNLNDAAKSVHLNASYLSQLFKQQLNKKFVDYLTELRIEEGKRLLRQTSLPMSEIADRVGYADISYFSNNFKKITGKTPSEYRKPKGVQA